MDLYNILLIGSGGREHAMATHFALSKRCGRLYIAPGNAGTMEVGTNLVLNVADFQAVKDAILQYNINLVVVGPEDPLVSGLVDRIHQDSDLADIMVFGPEAAGARLEGSKAFAKAFMQKYNIPTASYREFSKYEADDAVDYILSHTMPIVIKADGLAAGKGVIISPNADEAITAVKGIFKGQFGAAGDRIVIESFLSGIEFSVFVATNGEQYYTLPVAKDYKKILDGDLGPNTGGMGSVSPVPFVDDKMMRKVNERIILPTLHGLRQEGIPYVGFIFFGLIEVGGEPYVIEYNVRMGDPETEVVFPRILGDMVGLMVDLIRGNPIEMPAIDSDFAAGVYIVSEGYPGDYEKGKAVFVENVPNGCLYFHGGTKVDPQLGVVSNGGRVLFVFAKDKDMSMARKKALAGADAVRMEGKFYRRDIGSDIDSTAQ